MQTLLLNSCIWLAEWKPFEIFILLTILCTCVSLALNTPYPNDDTNELNILLVRSYYMYISMYI